MPRALPGRTTAFFVGLTTFVYAVVASSTSVRAQTPRATGPFSGLFGANARATNSQSLELRASVFGVRQSVELPQQPENELDPVLVHDGALAGSSVGLTYAFNRSSARSWFTLGNQNMISTFSVQPRQPAMMTGASALLGSKLTRKITLSGSATASYSPYFTFGSVSTFGDSGSDAPIDPNTPPPTAIPLPTEGFITGLPYGNAAGTANNMFVGADLMLTNALSRRSWLFVGLNYGRGVSFANVFPYQGRWSSRVGYGHRLSRSLSFRANYEQGRARTGPDTSSQTRSIDVGIEYYGRVQLSRRTTLMFNSSISGAGSPSVSSRMFYTVVGNASLVHQFKRTWSAAANFNRNLVILAGTIEPTVTDSVGGTLNGMFMRRLSWSNSLFWSRGTFGFSSVQAFSSITANSTLNVALGRRLGLYATYNYFKNNALASEISVPVLSQFGRQVIMAGVSYYTPLIGGRRNAR